MRANDRRASKGDPSEAHRRKLAAVTLTQTFQLVSKITKEDQQRFDALDPAGPRVSVVVSPLIRLREGAAPIRRILIFDNHPATLRLLNDVDLAQRKNNLALLEFAALIVLLLLAMFWRLL